jgi:hypothetical protein
MHGITLATVVALLVESTVKIEEKVGFRDIRDVESVAASRNSFPFERRDEA